MKEFDIGIIGALENEGEKSDVGSVYKFASNEEAFDFACASLSEITKNI